MPRLYPALDVTWSLVPDSDRIDLLLAEIDSESPTAVEMRDDGLRLFFTSAVARGRAAIRLLAFDPTLTCEPVEVSDEDWAERSQSAIGAIRIGSLVVTPLWSRADVGRLASMRRAPGAPDTVIIIQPSMGFGTGHHASTRLCLTLLQRIPLAGRRVLDIGTGSGILAIAAWRLGAASAVGIDHDSDALTAARESVQLNRATTAVSLATADLAAGPLPGAPFDVVLANLTGALITREASAIARAVAPGGHLIISGVMEDEEPAVTAALISTGLSLLERDQEQEWIGAVFSSIPNAPTASRARPRAPSRP